MFRSDDEESKLIRENSTYSDPADSNRLTTWTKTLTTQEQTAYGKVFKPTITLPDKAESIPTNFKELATTRSGSATSELRLRVVNLGWHGRIMPTSN